MRVPVATGLLLWRMCCGSRRRAYSGRSWDTFEAGQVFHESTALVGRIACSTRVMVIGLNRCPTFHVLLMCFCPLPHRLKSASSKTEKNICSSGLGAASKRDRVICACSGA